MKKFLIGASVLLSTLSFSQKIDIGSTRYGVTGGFNYSRVRFAHNPSGPRYTFHAGALALIPISDDDQFYLQPEVLYHEAGETGKDKNAQGTPGYNAIYANTYISVPIYIKGYFSEAESEFFGMFGPKFNFLINQKIENPSKPWYTAEGVDIANVGNVNGKASGFNFALSGAIGFSYKRKVEIFGKYDMGLSNTYKGLMKEPGADPNIAKKKVEHVASIGLSYIFD